jgi:hypothetical protein
MLYVSIADKVEALGCNQGFYFDGDVVRRK